MQASLLIAMLDLTPNDPWRVSRRDRHRLTDAAIDRFYDLYPVPDRAIVLFGSDNCLSISVGNPSHVDDLLGDEIWLKRTAYYVFGAIGVSISFAEIEVWREETKSALVLKTATLSDEAMTTATLERPTTAAPAPTTPDIDIAAPKFMTIDDIAAHMSVATGRSIAEIKTEILKNEPVLFVSSATAVEMLDKQIQQLEAMKARLINNVPSQERSVEMANNGAQAVATPPAAATAEAKPAAKKPPATKAKARKSRAKAKPAEEVSEVSAAS